MAPRRGSRLRHPPMGRPVQPERLFAPDRLRASGRVRAVLSPPDTQPLPLKPTRRVSGKPGTVLPPASGHLGILRCRFGDNRLGGNRRSRAPTVARPSACGPCCARLDAADDLRQARDGPPSGRRLSAVTPGRPPHACRPYNGADGGARDSHRHQRLALPERGWRLERDLPSAATSRSSGCRSPGTTCRMSRASVACGSPVVAASRRRRAGGSCLTQRAPARGRPDRSGVLDRTAPLLDSMEKRECRSGTRPSSASSSVGPDPGPLGRRWKNSASFSPTRTSTNNATSCTLSATSATSRWTCRRCRRSSFRIRFCSPTSR